MNAGYEFRTPAFLFELDLGGILEASGSQIGYRGIPRFPSSSRDIAFIIDRSVRYQEIMNAIRRLDTKVVEKVELFDVYYGGAIPEGKLSMAIRITCRSNEGTLRQREVDGIHSMVVGLLSGRFGAVVRGASIEG